MILVNKGYKIQEARILLACSSWLNPRFSAPARPSHQPFSTSTQLTCTSHAFVIPYDSFLLLFLVFNRIIVFLYLPIHH